MNELDTRAERFLDSIRAEGEAACAAIREETERILKDKAYLESVYKAGAEKASYVANKTLRKVYKKVGFVAK